MRMFRQMDVCRILLAFLAVVFIAAIAKADPVDALAEVNAARAQRGLKPFIADPQLTAGALNVAKFRADRLMFGHTANDFAGLPTGVTADAAGCAGNHPSWGFMACAMYENYTYAGAAKMLGRDGKLYCHLFVRGSLPSVAVNVAPCPGGVCAVPQVSVKSRTSIRVR